MTCAIYIIKNKIDNKPYVGQSQDIEKRWRRHKWELNNNRHDNGYLQRVWNKYGSNSFSFEIIKECGITDLNRLEKHYIQRFDAFNNGYNLTLGGDGCLGYKHTDEWKKKKSEAMMGEKNPNYEKKFSEETRRKMSETHLGKKMSEEGKNKLREINLGKKMSKESRKKMSEAKKKYTLWDPSKCHYDKRKLKDGSKPRRAFATRYDSKDVPIGYNLDFSSAEIIHDLINEACKYGDE